MSREIKFRAWDSKDECMHYQDDCYDSDEFEFRVTPDGLELLVIDEKWESGSGEWESLEYWRTAEGAEFMQYTGLKDRNGAEVYEGDLLRIPPKSQFEETTYNCFEVFYHDNECIGGQNIGFCMNRMHTQGNSAGGCGYKFTPESIANHGFVVIGNIYQNPELLEKQQ